MSPYFCAFRRRSFFRSLVSFKFIVSWFSKSCNSRLSLRCYPIRLVADYFWKKRPLLRNSLSLRSALTLSIFDCSCSSVAKLGASLANLLLSSKSPTKGTAFFLSVKSGAPVMLLSSSKEARVSLSSPKISLKWLGVSTRNLSKPKTSTCCSPVYLVGVTGSYLSVGLGARSGFVKPVSVWLEDRL